MKTHHFAVHPFDDEFMLEHDKVSLSWLEAHGLLEVLCQSVEQRRLNICMVVGEETHPAEAGNDIVKLVAIGVGAYFPDARN